ncbi:MAG: isoamylase [Verrucomicrobiota bacterium]|jgi:isoamylase|nr:isoamylase [Verrucomicrobiota bacterium]
MFSLKAGMNKGQWEPKIVNWPSIEGSPMPLGVTFIPEEEAYNFALYSKNATEVTLLLFEEENHATPIVEVWLEPLGHKTKRVWHCRLKENELHGACHYAYRVDGPKGDGANSRNAFDPDKFLLDPYAKGVYFPPTFSREAAKRPGANAGQAPLGIFRFHPTNFDWNEDKSPLHFSDAIIYELHVRGFTANPSSGLAEPARGTYAGLIEKIPYLKELGVTIVELMPVHQFDPQEGNYWGYMTLNFFSPHLAYASNREEANTEFKQMVRALHAAGIEVILDVVYNHTAEADQFGPTYSFKGIDNASFYLLTHNAERPYADFAGTGNTLNCADPFIRNLILDSLRYWVTEMHVDGFRFDLASILTRSEDGSIDWNDPPLLSAIRTDPVLSTARLIAEPWDAGGAYQLGTSFPGMFWHQWNGKFRDDIRRFVRGDLNFVPPVMRRLYGSDDLFPDRIVEARRPFYSINYIIAHDGFTLYDLVSYNERRNEANGHQNTDGPSDDYSFNYGWEGDEGAPPEVIALRKRQAKNFFCLLMLSNGIPMFAAGDEFLHTQGGNNNPYNQDNETTWLNWERLQKNADIFRFFKLMISFRKAHPTICRSRFWREEIRWRGVGPTTDLSYHSKSLAYYLNGKSQQDLDLYVMINAHTEPLSFTIFDGLQKPWCRVVDTSFESPQDILPPGNEVTIVGSKYLVEARSIVVLTQ